MGPISDYQFSLVVAFVCIYITVIAAWTLYSVYHSQGLEKALVKIGSTVSPSLLNSQLAL
jgi:hypothetical protein